MYPTALSLNSATNLNGLITNELAKGLAHKHLLMECNSTAGSRSCIYIAIILNWSRYSLNSSYEPCLMAFKESEVLLYTQLKEKQFTKACESLENSWIDPQIVMKP